MRSPIFGKSEGDGQGGADGCSKGFPGIGIQARRDIDRHDGFVNRIEVVDHLPIITPDLRIQSRAEDAIDEKVEPFPDLFFTF